VTNLEQSKNQEVKSLYQSYCKEHLDNEYLKLCDKVNNDLLSVDADVFKRGKSNIWAAAMVWAVGSVNFLGDRSSEPYASLKDICDHFEANTSTVGQKAGMIREWLDMDYFNEEYVRSDSSLVKMLDSLVMTEDGFIVPREMVEGGEDDEEEDDFENEPPGNYIAVITSPRKLKQADIYQIEYLFKTVLDEDEKIHKVYFKNPKTIIAHFYGKPQKVLLLDDKLTGGIAVSEIWDDLIRETD